MKRTRIRTKTTPKVRLNADGKPRERFEGLRDEDYRAWIRNLPCVVGKTERCIYAEHQSDAAHVESKARGSGDAGNLVPMCRRHHREQHDFGPKDFQRTYQVELRTVAGALWLTYEQDKGAPTL